MTPTFLLVSNDPDFRRGADRVDARVGVTGVGALVGQLHAVEDQAAVGRHQDVPAIRTHGDAVPVVGQPTLCDSYFIAVWTQLHLRGKTGIDD